MKSKADDNPTIRARFGEKVATRIRKQTKEAKDVTQYKAATKRFRPRKAELGKVVLLAATKTKAAKPGDRVTPGYKGKVFALYVTKNKTIKPYREKVYGTGIKRARAKHKTPQAYRPTSLDVQQFPTKAARKAAAGILMARGEVLVPSARIIAQRGNVAWHETVGPIATQKMADLANRATGGKGVGDLPMMVQVDVTVEQEDGSKRTIRVVDDFGQRREQGQKDAEFYGGFVQGKLYALVADQLSALGLVSKGSAKRVQRANKGRARKNWKWNGELWKKRDLKEARVSEVIFTPMLKRVSVQQPKPKSRRKR
jgi:hypothetical protein